MKRHATKEAFYERLQELAEVNKPALKESKNHNLGTLIDYKRAADGVAYGIIKESHNYYIKKAGLKQDPDIADFAYIGGQENITEFQYKKLSEADKQRNMMFRTINEAVSLKPDKNGSKKKKLNEDKAKDEIDNAESKLGDLDNATAGEKEMAAGVESMPTDTDVPPEGGGEEDLGAGLDAETPPEAAAPEGGAKGMPPEGGGEDLGGGAESMPPEGNGEDLGGGAEGMPPEGNGEDLGGDAEGMPPEGGGEEDVSGVEGGTEGGGLDAGAETDEPNKEIEKVVGKLTNKIRKTEMTDAQVKSYLNSFIVAFKDKLPDIEIEDRKEIANKLIKIVNQDDIDSLGDDIPQDDDEMGNEKEMGIAAEGEEQPCAECGSFGGYAESRGYNSPESFMECDDDEKTNVISGYANAHNDGMNDGDFKTIAIVITPEILEKLKGEYGHEDYAEKLSPYADSMNETSEEDKMAQLNEFWGGMGNLAKAGAKGIAKGVGAAGKGIGKAAGAAGNAIGGAAKGAYNAVGGAVKGAGQAMGQAGQAVKQAVGNAGQAISKTYNQGEVNPEVKKLEGIANNLGKQITALNSRLQKAGQTPINVQDILSQITQQLGTPEVPANIKNNPAATDAWKLGKNAKQQVGKFGGLKNVAESGMVDAGNVEVQPNMLREEEDEDEKDFNFNKKSDEPEEIETDKEVGTDEPETDNVEFDEPETDDIEIDEPEKTGTGDFSFARDSQSLGGGVVKPDGAPTTGVDITIDPDKTVQITMNEAKRKLIKQIAEGVNSYMNEISKNKSLIVNKAKTTTGKTEKTGNVVNKTGKGKDIGKQGGSKYLAKPIGHTKKFTKPIEIMSESEQKLRKYVRMRLEEKAGLRKSTLNESKKSTTLKKLDSLIDGQFKLYESVVKKKGNVNEMFGFSNKEKVFDAFKNLDPNDAAGIEKLLPMAFDILNNPNFKGAMDKARRVTPTQVKYQLLKQYVDSNGEGTLRTENGNLKYAPQSVKNNATNSQFSGGGRGTGNTEFEHF
jgi:hypothetical protein